MWELMSPNGVCSREPGHFATARSGVSCLRRGTDVEARTVSSVTPNRRCQTVRRVGACT